MGKRGVIIVHGTGQDITSRNELTVQLALEAISEGHIVMQLGGPGSTERVIRDSLRNNPLLAEPSPIDEISFPLDYFVDMGSGIALGSGVDRIVEELEEAVLSLLKQGVTEIHLVGFSRGAVSLAIALETIGKKMLKEGIAITVPISVCLLDPVPGPVLIPKHVEIPAFVKELWLMTSKHEGRLGFKHLQLSLAGTTKFRGDMVMGVHGDIGGSTGSTMTRLVKDDVSAFLKLKSRRLTPLERLFMALEITLEPEQYVKPSLQYRMKRRVFGEWSPVGLEPDTLELPSAYLAQEMETSSVFRALTTPTIETMPKSIHVIPPPMSPKMDIEWMVERMIKMRKKQLKLVVPKKSVVNTTSRRIVHAPPTNTVLPGNVETMKKLANVFFSVVGMAKGKLPKKF